MKIIILISINSLQYTNKNNVRIDSFNSRKSLWTIADHSSRITSSNYTKVFNSFCLNDSIKLLFTFSWIYIMFYYVYIFLIICTFFFKFWLVVPVTKLWLVRQNFDMIFHCKKVVNSVVKFSVQSNWQELANFLSTFLTNSRWLNCWFSPVTLHCKIDNSAKNRVLSMLISFIRVK